MIKDTIVIDLDGTLSDCSARQHLVMGKHLDYAAFNARISEDPVNAWCKRILQAMSDSSVVSEPVRLVVVSARPGSVLEDTGDWIDRHGMEVDELFCLRKEDDHATPAAELKREWLRDYGAARVLFAIDDDPRNAAMFKAEGVTCLLAPGWVTSRNMLEAEVSRLQAANERLRGVVGDFMAARQGTPIPVLNVLFDRAQAVLSEKP